MGAGEGSGDSRLRDVIALKLRDGTRRAATRGAAFSGAMNVRTPSPPDRSRAAGEWSQCDHFHPRALRRFAHEQPFGVHIADTWNGHLARARQPARSACVNVGGEIVPVERRNPRQALLCRRRRARLVQRMGFVLWRSGRGRSTCAQAPHRRQPQLAQDVETIHEPSCSAHRNTSASSRSASAPSGG